MHERLKQMAESAMQNVYVATKTFGDQRTAQDILLFSIAQSLAVIAGTGIDTLGRLEFLESRERERSENEDAFCQEMAELKSKGS